MPKADNEKRDGARAGPSLPFRVLKGACVALVTAAVGCGILYGLSSLREQVSAWPSYQMSAESLRLVKGPPWMTPEILAELDVTVLDPEFPRRFSLLDGGVAGRIAAAYERCPWVERVERIVKHDPRADPRAPPLEVFLKFRRPIAFVEVRDGFCLVDDKGVRLPGAYREPRLGPMSLLAVTGVSSPPPAVGQPWSDPGVEAAVRVAEAVDRRRETLGGSTVRQALRISYIDVSNIGGRRDPRDTEIALFTAGATRIKWGKPPTPEAALLQEKTLEQKVSYLDHVYQAMGGRVDGVLSYIDIPNEAVRRRATETVTRLRS